MKKQFLSQLKLSAFMLCSFLFLTATGAMAQEKDGGGLVIEEGEYEQEKKGALENIREYLFLNVGGFTTPTGQNKRHLILGNAGIDFSTDKFQVYAEGAVWKEQVNFRQERVGGCRGPEPCPEARDIKVKTDKAQISEAYLAYSPIPQFTVRAGRRKVVWGQFDVFSPVFFNLPVSTQNISTNFSKVGYAFAQDNVQVSVFPHERVELQGYFFLGTRISPLVADFARENFDVRKKDLQDHNQYAARVIFYPDWATIALTYYNGRNSFFVSSFQTLATEQNGNYTGESRDNAGLAELRSYSIEASVPRGRWNFIGEFSYRESEEDFESGFSGSEIIGDVNFLTRQPASDDDNAQAFFRWVAQENGGRLYGKTTAFFGGLGFQYEADKWKLEFAGYFFEEKFTGSATRGAELSRAHEPNSVEILDEGLQGAPFLNAAYYLTENKKSFLGLTAGFLGTVAAGASAYAVATIDRFDHLGAGTLQVVVGLDFLTYFSDSELSDLNETDDAGTIYELGEDLTIAPRLGFIWRF